MNRLKRTFGKIKQWFLHVVTTRFYYENCKQSVNLSLFKYKIQRRKDHQEKYGKYKDVEVFYYRRSKLKGYEYIQIDICHYLRFNIDLHRPL